MDWCVWEMPNAYEQRARMDRLVGEGYEVIDGAVVEEEGLRGAADGPLLVVNPHLWPRTKRGGALWKVVRAKWPRGGVVMCASRKSLAWPLTDTLRGLDPERGRPPSRPWSFLDLSDRVRRDISQRDTTGSSAGEDHPDGAGHSGNDLLQRVDPLDPHLYPIDETLSQSLDDLFRLPSQEGYSRLGLAPPRGMVLHGPSGCGKTTLMRCAARTYPALSFYTVSCPSMLSSYMGQMERTIRRLFAQARSAAPCVVVLEEADVLGEQRDESADDAGGMSGRVVGQILTELDGLEQGGDIIVVAVTSRPWALDPALLRPGRLEQRVLVGIPSRGIQREMVMALGGCDPDQVEEVVAMAEGCTPAHLIHAGWEVQERGVAWKEALSEVAGSSHWSRIRRMQLHRFEAFQNQAKI